MNIVRKVLIAYRNLQYRIYGRMEYGTMPSGKLCTHTPFEEDINHGDIVHPCVRYIPEGYLGHKWWMVYTPYYSANAAMENPILCYAESEEPIPPTHWVVAYKIQRQPPKGYNSDPTLFYDNGKMYVMWRENLTDRCEKTGFIHATFGAEIKEDCIGEIFGPLVGSNNYEEDTEVSPTFFKRPDGKYRCLAMHLRFHSPRIRNTYWGRIKLFKSFLNILDILGIWSQQRSYGIAQWSSIFWNTSFKLEETERIFNCNKLYRPWHMDLFEHQNKLYAIIQTNQCNADICLAESDDGIHFRMYKKPLMTNKTCGKVGIYKPTGGVVGNILYLYYTAQDLDNRKLNKLYLTTIDWNKL